MRFVVLGTRFVCCLPNLHTGRIQHTTWRTRITLCSLRKRHVYRSFVTEATSSVNPVSIRESKFGLARRSRSCIFALTYVSTRWLLVLKFRSCTFSPFWISLASLSPHSRGTSESASAYTSTLKVQLPSSIGRNVTEAVIWRKTDWISAWISASVFSSAASPELLLSVSVAVLKYLTYSGAEFSFPDDFFDELDLAFLLNIWTCRCQQQMVDLREHVHRTAIARHARLSLCW
jgi:hypothetical protein